jgi:hypothetical protein
MQPSGYPEQCVPVTPGTSYNFGLTYRLTESGGGVITCWLVFYADFRCQENQLTYVPEVKQFVVDTAPWTTIQQTATAPATAQATRFYCQIASGWEVDKLFLTTTPGTY